MEAGMIDTHAHIYVAEFDNDRDEIMKRAEAAGLGAIYLPAIDSSTHEAMMNTEAQYPVCRSMIGLHPCSVKEDVEKELAIIEQWLDRRPFVAIGEIGLDFYWDKTFTEQQYAAFHRQVQLALAHNLPIAIHSRNATDECIDVISGYPGLTGVFHCFSGNEEQARKLADRGFYLGIGGVVTFKNGGLDKVVQAIGTANLVLETDAPYLAPAPFRGKRNEPQHTKLVAAKIAQLLEMEVEEIAKITTANAKKLFRVADNP